MSTTNRLDGEETDNGRDRGGRFAPGNAGGPGRPRRATERAYLDALTEACPPETWKLIVESAVMNAGRGDRYAREWLSSYLMGRPTGEATTLHNLAVEELADVDPVQQDADLTAFTSWP